MRALIVCLIFSFYSFPGDALMRNWKYTQVLKVTRCFDNKNAKFWCEDFSYTEGKKKIIVQELQIELSDYFGVKRIYGYGKAIEGPLCKEHLQKIRSLIKNVSEFCISGEGESSSNPKESYARWRGLESKLGEINW